MDQQENIPIAPQPVPIGSVVEHDSRPRWGKGFLALAANNLVAGLGHWIVGRPRRAFFWFVTIHILGFLAFMTLVTPRLVATNIVLIPMLTMLSIASYVDSFLCGRRSTKKLASPFWRYFLGFFFIGVACYIHPSLRFSKFLKQHYIETYRIPTNGMKGMFPTLIPDDCLLVHKKSTISRWDLVVMNHPAYNNAPIPSRIVGLPGERVEIIAGQVNINGHALASPDRTGPYVSIAYSGYYDRRLIDKPGAGCEGNPIELGEKEYFVLGDNSSAARDARLWEITLPGHQLGVLPAEQITGRLTAIYWPPSRWRIFK